MFEKINYIQNGWYCVMASYGVAIEDLIGVTIQECFEGYCNYFQVLRAEPTIEEDYLKHFLKEQEIKKKSGYDIVHDFHQLTHTELGLKVRNNISLRKLTEVEKSNLRNLLDSDNIRLMVFLNKSSMEHFPDMHSLTVGHNGKEFVIYDVNSGIHSIEDITSIGEIGDCLLLVKKFT